MNVIPNPWQSNEASYIAHLAHERHMFAWCLVTHGNQSETQAAESARSFYRLEQPTDAHRGLAFHDEAWHWAMLQIHGEHYWVGHPELMQPSSAYRAESEAFVPAVGA